MFIVPGRFLGTLVAVSALVLLCAGSAAAVVVTFDGRVLRYREQPGETGMPWGARGVSLDPEPINAPRYLRVGVPAPVDFVRGCHPLSLGPGAPGRVELRCPVGDVSTKQLRYRLSLGDATESASVFFLMRGVVYGGKGDDFVGADRVYGGDGNDFIDGRRVYGGPGRDSLAGIPPAGDPNVLFGGTGNDRISAPGWLYGGPGDDQLSDLFVEEFDESGGMMVGGPGRDVVRLSDDGRSDVVRVRGGGVDRVRCAPRANRKDALFVDRSDLLSPSCRDATVLFTERPRYPYP
jgi:hypothetical protein